MAVNPLIIRIILNKLMFAKVKELLHAPAFPAMPFLSAVCGSNNSIIFESKNKTCLSFWYAQSCVSLITYVSSFSFTGVLNGPVNSHGLLSSVTAIKPDTSWGRGCGHACVAVGVISWLELVWCRYSCVGFAIGSQTESYVYWPTWPNTKKTPCI